MIAFLVMTGLNVVWSQGKEPLQQAVERGLNRADAQSRILAEHRKNSLVPFLVHSRKVIWKPSATTIGCRDSSQVCYGCCMRTHSARTVNCAVMPKCTLTVWSWPVLVSSL